MEETTTVQPVNYDESSIIHLEDMEHLRLRPTMYIGKLGNGSSHDDGIYVLIKEVIDNAIDEFTMGYGKSIEVTVDFAEKKVRIRDYGRGIPFGSLVTAVSRLNRRSGCGFRFCFSFFHRSCRDSALRYRP